MVPVAMWVEADGSPELTVDLDFVLVVHGHWLCAGRAWLANLLGRGHWCPLIAPDNILVLFVLVRFFHLPAFRRLTLASQPFIHFMSKSGSILLSHVLLAPSALLSPAKIRIILPWGHRSRIDRSGRKGASRYE